MRNNLSHRHWTENTDHVTYKLISRVIISHPDASVISFAVGGLAVAVEREIEMEMSE